MRFSIAAPIAALAATVAASDLGSWNVTLTRSAFANGYSSQSVIAIFVSDSYGSPGVITNCKSVTNPTVNPSHSSSCDPTDNGFSYEFNGTFIKVQQNVQKPNNMTVFGSAQLEMKVDDSVGRNFKGRAIFDVTSATA